MTTAETSCIDAIAAGTDDPARSKCAPAVRHQSTAQDRKLIDDLRAASNRPSLEAVLHEAALTWGFSDYTYTYFSRKQAGPFVLRLSMPGGMEAKRRFLYQAPLFSHCRKRISPIIWKADGEMRRLQVVTEAPNNWSDGHCGIAVPIHGPGGDFGVFAVSSCCGDTATCATRHLPLIHTAALVIHETAMRNCDNTRFGLQSVTVDALEFAVGREQERNMIGVSAVH